MDDDEPPKRVLSPLFWLAVASTLLCIVSGAIIGVYGPALFPARVPPAQSLGKPPPPR